MRRCIAAILALSALMGLLAVLAPAALADGDPASDVLLAYQVFDPPDAGLSAVQLARLNALVKLGDRSDYPLKVAIVASQSDLGSVTQAWKQQNAYGVYLGRELSYVFHGTLLVVMPTGYGLYDPVPTKDIPKGDFTATDDLDAPGSDLADGATLVVERLLRDNGVAVPAKLAFSLPRATRASTGAGPLIALAAGLILVLGAWAASLRARPLRRRAPVEVA